MRARSASAALSETFEREPMETYIFLPSGEKTMSRVQCPPLRRRAAPPERRAANCSAGPRALRSPLRYGNRITPSVFATYKNCGSSPRGFADEKPAALCGRCDLRSDAETSSDEDRE